MSWLPVAAHPFFPWLLLVIPAIGGLVSGVLVFTFAPEAEGHGTDSVIAAYHYQTGADPPACPFGQDHRQFDYAGYGRIGWP